MCTISRGTSTSGGSTLCKHIAASWEDPTQDTILQQKLGLRTYRVWKRQTADDLQSLVLRALRPMTSCCMGQFWVPGFLDSIKRQHHSNSQTKHMVVSTESTVPADLAQIEVQVCLFVLDCEPGSSSSANRVWRRSTFGTCLH